MTPPFHPPPQRPGPPPAGPGSWSPASGLPGTPRPIGTSILLAIVSLGVYTFVWTWKTHEEIKRHSGLGVGGPVGFVIYLVIAPVTYFLVPNEVREMLERAGRPSRVSAITGLWVLLPLVGSVVWFVKVQGQLNDYWDSLPG